MHAYRKLLAALCILVLSAGCTQNQDGAASDAADSAPSGGPASLTVYTALEDDQLSEYLPLWEAAHPEIEVELVRDSTGIITAKFLAEKDNPQADVIWGLAATSLLVADEQGLLEPYAPEGLERVNERFRDPGDPPKWVGIDAWMGALCVNTVETERLGLPIPSSWSDLGDPAYKGHLVMPNPASSGTGYLTVAGWMQTMGESEAWEYMDALHENMAVYTHSGSKPCKMAGTGEYPIGISFGYRAVKQRNDGEPIQPVFPTDGSGWDLESNALVKKAEIKPEARIFLDWAIGDPIMEKYAASYPVTSVDTGEPIPDGYVANPLDQMIDNDLAWAAASREDVLAEWSRRYDAKSEPKTE